MATLSVHQRREYQTLAPNILKILVAIESIGLLAVHEVLKEKIHQQVITYSDWFEMVLIIQL